MVKLASIFAFVAALASTISALPAPAQYGGYEASKAPPGKCIPRIPAPATTGTVVATVAPTGSNPPVVATSTAVQPVSSSSSATAADSPSTTTVAKPKPTLEASQKKLYTFWGKDLAAPAKSSLLDLCTSGRYQGVVLQSIISVGGSVADSTFSYVLSFKNAATYPINTRGDGAVDPTLETSQYNRPGKDILRVASDIKECQKLGVKAFLQLSETTYGFTASADVAADGAFVGENLAALFFGSKTPAPAKNLATTPNAFEGVVFDGLNLFVSEVGDRAVDTLVGAVAAVKKANRAVSITASVPCALTFNDNKPQIRAIKALQSASVLDSINVAFHNDFFNKCDITTPGFNYPGWVDMVSGVPVAVAVSGGATSGPGSRRYEADVDKVVAAVQAGLRFEDESGKYVKAFDGVFVDDASLAETQNDAKGIRYGEALAKAVQAL
ncbi:hypothetical protein HDU96_008894 [Phlyctochytrium bullatum]|nr:hypothetical protein HDU96_008894 [Phlyctochytrium bullatum]